MRLIGIVLAAGQGKRMKSKLYKVLHQVCGKPMVGHAVDTLRSLEADRIVTIVGHGAEQVKGYLQDKSEYALQAEQLGTAHAVMQAAPLLKDEDGVTVVICGDTPLITADTLRRLAEQHEAEGAAASVLTAMLEQPDGYGRVIRAEDGSVRRIVEHKDCSPEERQVREINTGTYCFDNRKLFEALTKVTNDNAQGEYYLPDVVSILKEAGERIAAHCLEDPAEATGVNDRVALAEAEQAMRKRLNREHMRAGVTFIDPDHSYVGADVVIGADTIVYPGTFIEGRTVIGEDCRIGPNAHIADSRIGNGVAIKHSTLNEASVGDESTVGPYAYLRPGAKLGIGVKIGDFVEIKNATIADGSKVSHLSYVGDAEVGRDVNIGCGAITVNYDGFGKHKTVIEDEAFVGSNVNLIAPVVIGKGAYVVAGSTITHDVESDALAIARERQTTKPGYAAKIKARLQAKKKKQ